MSLFHRNLMMLSHSNLIELIGALGYQQYINKEGMCYGISSMALHAILANDMETFNRRLKALILVQNFPPEKFKKLIENVEQKRIDLLRKHREALLEALKSSTTMDDPTFYKMLKEREKDELVKKYYQECSNINSELTEEERNLIDVRAFFEGIILYFSPELFSHLFPKHAKVDSQNAEHTFSRGLPRALVEKTMFPDDKELLKEVEEKKLPVEQGLVKKDSMNLGVYDKEELTKFFEKLCPATLGYELSPPAALLLGNGSHAIIVSYDSAKKCWQLVDPNKLPVKEYKTNDDIAKAVTNCFSLVDNGITAFHSEIFYNATTKNVEKWLEEIKQDDEWQKLHAMEGRESKINSNGVGLLYLATTTGKVDVVKRLLELGADPNQATQREGETPLYLAAQASDVELVKAYAEFKKTDLNKADNGITALYISTQIGNKEVVDILIKQKADLNKSIDASTQVLIEAAESSGKKEKVIGLFKSKGINTDDTLDHFTPLHAAIFFGHANIAKALMDAGADVTTQTKGGITAVEFAEAMDQSEILAILQKALSKTKIEKPASDITSTKATLFDKATTETTTEIVKPKRIPGSEIR